MSTETPGRLLTPDEYMQVLEGRLAEWERQNPGDGRLKPLPPLLSWLVRDGDEQLVDVDAWEAAEDARRTPVKRERTPRPPVDVEALKARRDRLVAQRDAIGAWRSDDPAATRLKPKVARRVNARTDRDLEKYTRLTRQIARLEWRIAGAEKAEVGK